MRLYIPSIVWLYQENSNVLLHSIIKWKIRDEPDEHVRYGIPHSCIDVQSREMGQLRATEKGQTSSRRMYWPWFLLVNRHLAAKEILEVLNIIPLGNTVPCELIFTENPIAKHGKYKSSHLLFQILLVSAGSTLHSPLHILVF